ncbi:MAG: oxidoreductase-like domain-containing protein [Luteimonas sp.]
MGNTETHRTATIGIDPKPLPPPAPAPGACCGEGCAHCVLDLHDAAMEQYESDLAAWHARQARA